MEIEEIGAKMDALGLWEVLSPYNWAVWAFPVSVFDTKSVAENVKMKS